MPVKKTPSSSAETKTRKPAAKKKAAPPTEQEIAQLAARYWMERGRPEGTPETDWMRAEQELRGANA